MHTIPRLTPRVFIKLAVCALALPAWSPAQQGIAPAVLPAGLRHLTGQRGDSQPFAGASARYQQIHDAVDLAAIYGRRSFLAKGMAFRPSGSSAIAPRTWNVQLVMAYTSRPSAKMSTTFADNLGTAPTTVLPFTRFSSPAGRGKGSATTPNPAVWSFPFRTPFAVDANRGHLCWQWQHYGSSLNAQSSMDGVAGSGSFGGVRILPATGMGCTAKGRTIPAYADFRIYLGYVDSHLIGAPANTPAVAWVGMQRTELRVPGWCAPLLVAPLIEMRGRTTASGTWYSGSLNTLALNITPYAELYVQYAFADPSLPGGIGLSNLATVATPASGGQYVARVATIADSTNTRHRDRLGRIDRNTGLVVLFDAN